MAKQSRFAQPFQEYEIVERLGAGGMGVVFKARRKSDGSLVALKVLHPSRSRNKRFIERLRREAEISQRLDHAHVVRGHGFGEEGGYQFLVMDFIEGRSLRELLKLWGRFPEEQVVDIGRQIAEALRCAHQNGIVHRDVKPANILVDDDGNAKLTDLGLAKADTDPTVTRDGATVGTPQYMSPEQAKDPRSVDERGDLYSLGATLYHMLTGSPPFEGDSVGQLIHNMMSEDPKPASELCEHLSPGFDLILRKLLMRDLKLRYATADELLQDFDRISRGEEPSINPKALRSRARTAFSTKRVVVLCATGLLLVFGLWQSFFATGGTGKGDAEARQRSALSRFDAIPRSEFRARLAFLRDDKVKRDVSAGIRLERKRAVLADLDRALAVELAKHGETEFQAFLERQGMRSWSERWLDGVVRKAIETAVGMPVKELPAVARSRLDSWRRATYAECRDLVEGRCRALLGELTQGYETRTAKRVDRLLEEQDYAAAHTLLTNILENPWGSYLKSTGRTPGLPEQRGDLLDPLLERVRSDLALVERRSKSAVDEWQRIVLARLDAIRDPSKIKEESGRPWVEHARTVIHEIRARDLSRDSQRWKSLPRKFEPDMAALRSRVLEAEQQVNALNLRLERAFFADLVDSIHERLSRDLDFETARRTLLRYSFVEEEVRDAKQRMSADLSTLERATQWAFRVLSRKGRPDERWVAYGRGYFGRVVGVAMPKPSALRRRLLFREQDGGQIEFPFEALDSLDVYRKLQRFAAKETKEHEEGLGLLLFYRDRFEEAKTLLASSGRLDEELRSREARRRLRLAERKNGTEAEIAKLLKDVESYLARGKLEAAAYVLEDVRKEYGGRPAMARHAARMAALRRTLDRERRLLTMRARLGAPFRTEASLSISEDASDRERKTLTLELDFAAKTRFLGGIGSWMKTKNGLRSPKPRPGEKPDDSFDLGLPIFDRSRGVDCTLSFRVPARGDSPDLLGLQIFGLKVLLLQAPGRPCFVHVTTDKDALASAGRAMLPAPGSRAVNRSGRRALYLVRGARYTLRIRSQQSSAPGRHQILVDLQGESQWSGTLRLPAGEQRLQLTVQGPILLEKLQIQGRPSRD